METSQIKNFAQSLRNQLRDGVKQRLLYWGFNEKGEVNERPEPVEGGYMFRGDVFSDETVPNRWKQLKRMIDLHSIDYAVEEGAYTWFNRLMAIHILEKNDYIQPQLEYEDGTQLPHLLQNARRAIFPDMKDNELKQVKKQLRENRDNEAFARLLTHLCDTQQLISKVFGKISYSNDYTELLLPQNLLDQEGILDFIVTTTAITDKDFEQVELIGWLYQYYISEKKDEVFKSFKKRKKAGPEELPAATQIFTPEWIVRYMVENTVGRLWLDLHPDSPVRDRFKYFVEPAEENSKAEPIIEDVTDLTLLDPAAGSGHILVVGFEYLMDMYREEGYTARQAIEGILENNLYGLEIDERAAQLARFAVLLKAARYDQSVLDGEKLPHIHSFPEKTNISTAEIREFFGNEGEPYVEEFKDALQILQEGKNFGSTIRLEISEEGVAFAQKRIEALQPEAVENLAIKQLLGKVEAFIYIIKLLNNKYKAVAANPPYMGSRNMKIELKDFVKENYSDSKKDFFAVFMELGWSMLTKKGLLSMINQHSWMFLSTYENLREKVIKNYELVNLIHLGSRAFDELSGEVVQSTAFTMRNDKPGDITGKYYRLTNGNNSIEKRDSFLRREQLHVKKQSELLKIPRFPIAYWVPDKIIELFTNNPRVNSLGFLSAGVRTGKNSLFIKYWYEIDLDKLKTKSSSYDDIKGRGAKWFPITNGGPFRKWYGNYLDVVDLEQEARNIKEISNDFRLRDPDYYFQQALSWTKVCSGKFSSRYVPEGVVFGDAGPTLFVEKNIDEREILGYLNSALVQYLLLIINPTLNYTLTDISYLPFKEIENSKLAELVDECIKIAKKDWDQSELSWEFKSDYLVKSNKKNLKGALSSVEKYISDCYKTLIKNEFKINKIILDEFDIDGIKNEIKFGKYNFAKKSLQGKSINKNDDVDKLLNGKIDKIFLLKSLLSYLVGCVLGRYHLKKDGLYIASQHVNKKLTYSVEYPVGSSPQLSSRTFSIDKDGITPLMGNDSPFSDDLTNRIKNCFEILWGESELISNLNVFQEIIRVSVEEYLNNDYWEDHVKLYNKCPIYWLFSSKNGTFKVLAYMHRMDKYTVQKVRQNYLHPYMDYLRNEMDKLEDRDSLNSDESKQLDTYRSNLNECLEYDEVIKEVADKQIDFDLDDGVKHNYELFGKALAKI